MDENKKQQNSKGNLKTIRTYMGDMADTVRANDISVIKVALAEQNKNEQEDQLKKAEGSNSKKIFWFLGGIVFITVAIYGPYLLIKQKQRNDTPPQLIKQETIISYDEISEINLITKNNLENKLNEVIKDMSTLNKNGVIKFIPIEKTTNGIVVNISIKELFDELKLTAPSSLVRSLSDNYMIGTYTKNPTADVESNDSKSDLFMILETKDYGLTYAGMLEWEKTIASDMFYLFKLDTKETKLKLKERIFRDILLNNKDARVLYNENKDPILYYIFADKSKLIITDNQETIKEVISRLTIKNIKPL